MRILGYSLLLLGNKEVIQNLLETGIKDWFLVGMNSLVIRWYCFKKALRCRRDNGGTIFVPIITQASVKVKLKKVKVFMNLDAYSRLRHVVE